jgi:hypothetical protein
MMFIYIIFTTLPIAFSLSSEKSQNMDSFSGRFLKVDNAELKTPGTYVDKKILSTNIIIDTMFSVQNRVFSAYIKTNIYSQEFKKELESYLNFNNKINKLKELGYSHLSIPLNLGQLTFYDKDVLLSRIEKEKKILLSFCFYHYKDPNGVKYCLYFNIQLDFIEGNIEKIYNFYLTLKGAEVRVKRQILCKLLKDQSLIFKKKGTYELIKLLKDNEIGVEQLECKKKTVRAYMKGLKEELTEELNNIDKSSGDKNMLVRIPEESVEQEGLSRIDSEKHVVPLV